MKSRNWNTLILALGLGCAALVGCAKKPDVIVQTGAEKELTAPAIDKDPLALLPGNAIGLLSVDTKALFASPFGGKLLALVRQHLPVPESAGFEPARDLKHVYLGSYSMQGLDVSGVAVGTFDQAKIEAAANGVDKTPLGVPLTKSTYAGRTLYTSSNVGFCIVTEHTALVGNDTGIRRALDRIREGRAQRQAAPWLDKLLADESAPIVGGADLRKNPIPDAARTNLSFLNGLETLVFVGNFADPGLNLAGTLSYPDEASAKSGGDNVKTLAQTLSTYAPFMAMLGIPNPVQKLEAQSKDKQVEFVLGVDGGAMSVIIDKAPELIGVNAR
jgi:hypothetical protein